jgi:hypothetical protein
MNCFNDELSTDQLTINGVVTDLGNNSSNIDYDTLGSGYMRFTFTGTAEIHGFLNDFTVGRLLTIVNANSTGNPLVLKTSSSSNTSNAYAINALGQDILLFAGDAVTLQWRANNLARWGIISRSRAGTRLMTPQLPLPTQITATTHDYPTTGVNQLQLNTDASQEITGFANGGIGKMLIINNVGSFNIVLKHQNAGSTSSNRMILGNAGVDITILPNDTVSLIYDNNTLRWRLLSKSF